jgi:CDP-diacylglycerol--glycerol-3-phosphate 3-phosphatidyltransferase
MTMDSVASALLLGAAVVVGLWHIRTRNPPQFTRVATDGGSPFLGMGPMRAVYWAIDPVAEALVQLGISANTITLASLLMAVTGGVFIAFGHFGVGALVSALAALGDALDGRVARKTNTASDAGEVLDAAVDRYGEFAFLAGLALFYRGSALLLLVVLLSVLGSFMVSYATAKAEALSVVAPRGSMRRAERAAYLILGTALSPLVAAAVPAGADAPVIFVVLVVGVVSNVSAAYRLTRIAELASARARLLASGENWPAPVSSPRKPSDGSVTVRSSPEDSRA